MIQKHGQANWRGGLRDGQGTLSVESGAMRDQGYSFAKRFGDEAGTNPEELIGAAHASCFAMALSADLERAGLRADSIDARSTVTLDMSSGAPVISRVHVEVAARVPGADDERFREVAEGTKQNCPVSKVLSGGAQITMTARLE
ncbi:OsmC family protein [Rubellimicrobium aerolatum]|uniref:OsmC family protein n=1 Tax=Rubellimicrobium aerolatum TaxID=490979 RepID=A0ABW0SBX8_9RHOB|nr:OsmC family protein [Rubellimicrobium aerolatum]MBP1805898.1 osmotically inducible protein OsmC [Rubellimicrobium aerolatum]